MNTDIGHTLCAHCYMLGKGIVTAPLRRNKRGRLYYSCPNCGIDHPTLAGFQEYCRTFGVMEEGGEIPDPPARPDPHQVREAVGKQTGKQTPQQTNKPDPETDEARGETSYFESIGL